MHGRKNIKLLGSVIPVLTTNEQPHRHDILTLEELLIRILRGNGPHTAP